MQRDIFYREMIAEPRVDTSRLDSLVSGWNHVELVPSDLVPTGACGESVRRQVLLFAHFLTSFSQP